MIKIILCEQNPKWLENFSVKLKEGMDLVASVDNGKKVQENLSQNDIDVVILNIETKNFSFIEVIKFIKQNQPRVHIVLLANNEKIFKEYFYTEKEIQKLGVNEIFIKPFPVFKLVEYIEDSFKHTSWNDLQLSKVSPSDNFEGENVKAQDQNFSSLKNSHFSQNSICIFDLYLRLGKNKYLKIFRKGEHVDLIRVKKYLEKDPNLNFYFKVEDRLSYINFANEVIQRKIGNSSNFEVVSKMVKASTELIVDEIYTNGLPPFVVEETVRTIQNVMDVMDRNLELRDLYLELISYGDEIKSHVSLTTFYTGVICKNLDWVTSHSRGSILMGAILHDIGKVKLPKVLATKKVKEFSQSQLHEYKKHPEIGVQLLDRVSGVKEQVKQIILQHHELNNLEGFPYGLSGSRIYPLAKIVSFANFFAEFCMEKSLPPMKAMKTLLEEKDEILRYEPSVIKSFIKGFVKDE